MSSGFRASPIIRQFTSGFKTLFFKSYGNHACLPRVAESCLLDFKKFIDIKFLRVTKSFVDKSLNKLVKKCFRMGFFKLACSLKKSIACVNIV